MPKGSSLLKRIALSLGVVVCALVIFGFVSAKSAQTEVEVEIRAMVQSKGIMGRGLGGERAPPEVGSHVDWPFIVIGWYSVPFDLHASYHQTRYLVLPWGRYVLGQEEFFPV